MRNLKGDSTAFDAILYPNQPLSARHASLVLAVSTTVALALGTGFALVGAWPVAGFLGLDIVLLGFGFHWARRRSTRRERVKLDASGLLVEAFDGRGGHRSWRFEPYWVRLHMDEPPQRHSLITLRSNVTTIRLGAFLTPDDRLSFAKALAKALQNWR